MPDLVKGDRVVILNGDHKPMAIGRIVVTADDVGPSLRRDEFGVYKIEPPDGRGIWRYTADQLVRFEVPQYPGLEIARLRQRLGEL